MNSGIMPDKNFMVVMAKYCEFKRIPMGNSVSHVNRTQCQITVCILLMTDKNNRNKVIRQK
jgi:hypothetical protein